MKEQEDRYMAVVEKHTLVGASTITLMKHKQICIVLAKGTHMDGAVTLAIIQCCEDFQVDRFIKCLGMVGRLRSTFLG